MNSRVLYKGVLLLLAVGLLGVAAHSQRKLNRVREQLGLIRLPVPENAPPVLAFTTVVLGGFRGLIANALWIRATDLQEEGKYFEMVQLADWITKLQPYFSTVWEHLAWNMAYNISIKFTDPAERWPWVLRGIELLRDQGLQYNPKERGIYYGLSMLFQHKMGGNLDDAQMYYKNIWAEEMTKVFPTGHPDFAELLAPKTEDARQRVRLLKEKFKMDPQRIREVENLYGPLEWRLPDAHAIYWAYSGLQNARKDDLMQLRRVIYQSMQLAFARGRLIVAGNFFELGPNLDIIPKVSASYEEMIREEPTRDDIPRAHRNFLKNAVYFLYTHNRLADATRWFAYLHEKYPNAFCAHAPNSPEHVNCPFLPASLSLDDYAVSRIQEDIGETSRDKTKANLEGLMRQAFLSLAVGEGDRAAGLQNLAEKIWFRYMLKIKGQEKRVGLPPFQQIREEVLNGLLDPEHGLNPELASRLRTALNLPAPAPTAAPEPNGPK